jgi:hypothetical protein
LYNLNTKTVFISGNVAFNDSEDIRNQEGAKLLANDTLINYTFTTFIVGGRPKSKVAKTPNMANHNKMLVI